MPNITVFDRDGTAHELTGDSGKALMESLRDADLIEATCGGAASCGTCHIYLRDGWAEKCGERTEDEGYMLEALEEEVEVKPVSRLACQITLADDHDEITMDIAPQL